MNAGGYAGVGVFPYDCQADTSDEYGSESVPVVLVCVKCREESVGDQDADPWLKDAANEHLFTGSGNEGENERSGD